jgi:hypothetical protein
MNYTSMLNSVRALKNINKILNGGTVPYVLKAGERINGEQDEPCGWDNGSSFLRCFSLTPSYYSKLY